MKKILSLFLVLILAFSITACNKKVEPTDVDTDNEPSTTDEGTDSTEDTTDDTEEVWEPSGHIIIGNENFSGEFINGWGNAAVDNDVRKLIFGGASNDLAGLLATNQDGQLVLNSITESREISDDGLVSTFKLKPDLVYSDGTPLTADDVVFTYELYLDKEAMVAAGGSSSYGDYIEKVEKIDDLTIQFTIRQKFYATDANVFLQNILSEEWAMKDKPADISIQQHIKDSLISTPLGYGPYKLVEYVDNQFVKLTVNENYIGNFDGQKPGIKDVIYKVVSMETDIDELLTGNVDVLPGMVEAPKIDAAKADDATFAWSNYPRQGYGYLDFHNDFGPVRHKEVRQAIAYTMDRAVFREAFLGKYAMSTDGPYTTNYWMIDEEWVDANLTKYTPNVEKVNEILSEAGWAKDSDGIWAKDGERLEIELLAPGQSWADPLNLTLDKTAEEFGIKFNISVIDWSIFLNHYYGDGFSDENERQYHMFALATSLPIVFEGWEDWHSEKISEPWGIGVSTNSSRFKNDKNDELLLTMRTAKSDEIYQNAYKEWVQLLNEEMPTLPIYSNDYHDLYNNRIKGFETNALWDWPAALLYCTVE